MAVRPVFRFAPSPNGLLHLGHAYSALLNQHLAMKSGGDLLLRIEDIDVARCTPTFEAAIGTDLAWLGLRWREPIRRQSAHFALYGAVLDRLAARDLVYPCFCTRGDIARALAGKARWPRDPDGSPLYPRTCRTLVASERERRIIAGHPFCLRLDHVVAAAAVGGGRLTWTEYREGASPALCPVLPRVWGDAVLRRKDIPASYHLAVVVDDAVQAVTDVVRGEDLWPATSLHRLLQALLGYPEPAYHHHVLVRDDTGQKLSKSRGSESLARLRDAGVTADQIRHRLDRLPSPQFEARFC